MSKNKAIKKPIYTAEELNSNIAYGMTTINNITQAELNSIQWLCEKSMNDDIKIKNLQSQLAEKEKEIEYQESMKILAVKNQNQKVIEQLEKVKDTINKLPITDMTDYGGFKKIYQADATRIIDQQIKELKGKVETILTHKHEHKGE